MLADPERIEARLISALDVRDQIEETVRRADRAAVLGECRREAVDPNLHVSS